MKLNSTVVISFIKNYQRQIEEADINSATDLKAELNDTIQVLVGLLKEWLFTLELADKEEIVLRFRKTDS